MERELMDAVSSHEKLYFLSTFNKARTIKVQTLTFDRDITNMTILSNCPKTFNHHRIVVLIQIWLHYQILQPMPSQYWEPGTALIVNFSFNKEPFLFFYPIEMIICSCRLRIYFSDIFWEGILKDC